MAKNSLITTFLEIVQIDSPTGSEEALAKYVFDKLKKLGLRPIRDSFGNVIARVAGVGESIILTAHLDTVEPGKGVVPTIEKGVIKSTGDTILGADNKAAVAAILEVAKAIATRGFPTHPVEIIFTLSEEVGSYGAVNLNYSHLNSKHGYSFDIAAKVGTIVTSSPFYNRFDIEIIGKPAHASRPKEAINVLPIFADALNHFSLGRVDADTICNIGIVESGSARNTIPGILHIKGEVRSFVDSKLTKTTNKILGAFRKSAKKNKTKIKTEVVRENGGYKLKPTNPLIIRVKKVMQNLNIKPRLFVSYGCADSNIFVNHQIQILNLGDGSIATHTNKERISVVDLNKVFKLALNLVKN